MRIASLDTFLALFSPNPSNYWTDCKRNTCFSKCLCLVPNPACRSVNYSHSFILDYQFFFPCTSSFVSRKNYTVVFLHVVSLVIGIWPKMQHDINSEMYKPGRYHFPSRLQSCPGSMLSSSLQLPLLCSARPPPGSPTVCRPAHPSQATQSPFSPSETSSHQQALHVRRCLFSWVTELSPILPLLWKRSCLVTETHEEHFASSLSSIGSNSCCFGTGCLLNANAKEVRNQFLCFKWFQVRPHLCSNAPRKNKTPDPIQQEVFTTKYQLQLRTELWFLYSYNKLVVRDEKHRRLQRRFSAEHAYPHIHTLIYIRALPVVLQLSAACQGKKIY